MTQNSGSLKIKDTSHISTINEEVLIDLIVDSIQDIKGKHIVKLDLTGLEDAPASFFIICEGDSNTQIRSISQNIYKRVKEDLGLFPNHIEGMMDSRWVLVDFFDTVVHIFHPETRNYYNLEGLWNDAEVVEYEDLDMKDITSS